MTKQHQFMWLDLETTGLDPTKGRVLEFAVVLCEDALGDDFAIVEQYSSTIRVPTETLASLSIDRYVREMHERNDLWFDVAKSNTSVEEVDEFLASLAGTLSRGRLHAVSLAGSSVHFDLAWCRVHMPRFARYLSHRVFDITTLRRACDAWSPTPIEWPKREAHRALADVHATIAEARVARKAMFGGAS